MAIPVVDDTELRRVELTARNFKAGGAPFTNLGRRFFRDRDPTPLHLEFAEPSADISVIVDGVHGITSPAVGKGFFR